MFVKRPESIWLYLASALVATATVLNFTTVIKAQTASSANAETIIPLEGLDPVMLDDVFKSMSPSPQSRHDRTASCRAVVADRNRRPDAII
jgi:hypothetical protein